jgi:hypothetical protein
LAAVGLLLLAAPALASAAKVTVTAPGGVVPSATGGGALATVDGVLAQPLQLKGGKVKGKQVLDVNVTISLTGNRANANIFLRADLIGPKGDHVPLPIPSAGSSVAGLTFDDQSRLIGYCNPLMVTASICNYAVGATPTSMDFASFTGNFRAPLNEVFRGLNPKGEWTLEVRNNAALNPPVVTTLGTTILEVKTGKRFAKEDGK